MDDNDQQPDLAEETVEPTPDEPAPRARREIDPRHERNIPHTEDLQDPEGDNRMPGDGFVPTSSSTRIN